MGGLTSTMQKKKGNVRLAKTGTEAGPSVAWLIGNQLPLRSIRAYLAVGRPMLAQPCGFQRWSLCRAQLW